MAARPHQKLTATTVTLSGPVQDGSAGPRSRPHRAPRLPPRRWLRRRPGLSARRCTAATRRGGHRRLDQIDLRDVRASDRPGSADAFGCSSACDWSASPRSANSRTGVWSSVSLPQRLVVPQIRHPVAHQQGVVAVANPAHGGASCSRRDRLPRRRHRHAFRREMPRYEAGRPPLTPLPRSGHARRSLFGRHAVPTAPCCWPYIWCAGSTSRIRRSVTGAVRGRADCGRAHEPGLLAR